MLQFLKFDKEKVQEAEYRIISGNTALKFFAKRAAYVLFFAYSTIFVAAIDPFVNSIYEAWAFYVGGLITTIFIIRLSNHAVKYIKFQNGRILLKPDSIAIFNGNDEDKIPADSIKLIEVNALGNIVIRSSGSAKSFPLTLLQDDDRDKFIASFTDTACGRTEFFRKVWDFFDALLIAFILAMHIREYIIQAYFIPTGSMEDTLLVGDHLLVEKITYGPIIPRMIGMNKSIHLNFLGIRNIERGDIVIFKPPGELKKDYIKRCIALPGDELHLKNGSIYLNGARIEEPFTKGFTSYDGFSDKKMEGIVPEGMIVVFGDNRENSYDSRGFGYLSIERIRGRAFVLYWNTQQIRNLDFSRYGLIR